jgi:hypothetical protein
MMASGGTGRAFDRVEIANPTAGGLPRRLTRSEWEGLPLDQRVRAILSKKLRFFNGDSEIPIRAALEER